MNQQKNFVSLKDETVRIFENPFLDWCSRIHWIAPLVVWLPAMVLSICLSVLYFHFPPLQFLLYFCAGLFIWTVSEYVLHRFVFHYNPTSQLGKRLHFLMHGVHHDYPNDSKRLVMPPIMSLLISIPFFTAFYFGFGKEGASFAAFAGLVLGYLSYDMLHYAVHHAKWQNSYFEKLKKHHMAHHFVHPEAAFGVSNMFWDVVFGTQLDKARKKSQEEG